MAPLKCKLADEENPTMEGDSISTASPERGRSDSRLADDSDAYMSEAAPIASIPSCTADVVATAATAVASTTTTPAIAGLSALLPATQRFGNLGEVVNTLLLEPAIDPIAMFPLQRVSRKFRDAMQEVPSRIKMWLRPDRTLSPDARVVYNPLLVADLDLNIVLYGSSSASWSFPGNRSTRYFAAFKVTIFRRELGDVLMITGYRHSDLMPHSCNGETFAFDPVLETWIPMLLANVQVRSCRVRHSGGIDQPVIWNQTGHEPWFDADPHRRIASMGRLRAAFNDMHDKRKNSILLFADPKSLLSDAVERMTGVDARGRSDSGSGWQLVKP